MCHRGGDLGIEFYLSESREQRVLCRYSKRRGVAANSRVVLIVLIVISIGCAASAPDGSSPRGYVRLLVVEYRLKLEHLSEVLLNSGPVFRVNIFLLTCISRVTCISRFDLFFIGCATSAPDGSSPRGYGRMLAGEHRLK